ncbi:Zinc finger protein ZAT11 [Heracleum sosnowskyi]|uniref:Zinc finger protein ZAT11 n=1 Tax=Heracleum sosnowskyi TaxID=360622 RepID=A0AAD8N6H2_9APIA|nr:Zinc finger protein ZAT11 [Heracleum sosnowskyi]
MMMKKFHNTDDVERFAMANCAMILDRAESRLSEQGRAGQIFECKTCQRSFSSFQALGGHTASHKRPKLVIGGDMETQRQLPKPHKCTVCYAEFWTGQALGGHMRKHRSPRIHEFLGNSESINNNNNSSTVTSSSDDHSGDFKMGSNIGNCYGKRVLGLDLNLSPEQNELKVFGF